MNRYFPATLCAPFAVAAQALTLPTAAQIESATARSAAMRLELREEGTVGHALVTGVETKGAPDGLSSAAWDTSALATGWQTLTSGTNAAAVLKLDGDATAIEGGRLQSNTTWNNAKTHVVRHWVVVPNGVTLTISQGSIVKFCEGAGIKVLSGGKVQISGAEGADVFFASIGNDTYGGDTNLRDGDFATNAYEIVTLNGGTWSDNGYWVTPDAQLRGYPEVTLHDSLAAVSDGLARIPVTVEGTRNAPFSIDWAVTAAASAALPFAETSGTLSWSGTSEGTKYIEIPLKSTYTPNGVETFTVRATLARSVTRANETCAVRVFRGDIDLSALQFATSAASAGRRIELREEGTVGHALVTGVETKGAPDGSSSAAWDTSALATGWQTLTSGTNAAAVLKLDGGTAAIEGGRLQSNTTWNNAKTHVVRHWVVVPNGVTLTISQGSIVKFCEGAGIKVLPGGKVQINGAEGADVFFASIGNDTYGGDTNLRDGDFATNAYEIVTLNGGTWSDNGYWVTPDAVVRPYPTVTLHDAIGDVEGGVVRVPVSVDGTRNAPFSIDWAVTAATSAALPFAETSGTLSWSGTSEGTKYIEIPLRADYESAGTETFALAATRARSVNLANDSARVMVYNGRIAVGDVIENGESGPSAATEIETRGIGGTLIAKAVETIRYDAAWGGAAECSIALDGNRLLSNAAGAGALTWSRPSAPGLYTFTHTAGRATLTARLAVLGEDSIAIDGTRIKSDAIWTADKVWIVRGTVMVASGATLTIQPGAVVKFAPGATLAVESGATCVARGAIFTHLYDDTAGGDTLGDGDATAPKMDDYAVTGTVTDDDSTEWRYTAPVILSGTINADTRWRGWKVYRVTGNLTVASGKTLKIEPGAVVKFNAGVSLTVNSGATLDARGTRAQPIVFTSAKDDEHGGDTNGDGDKTYPYAGDWATLYVRGGTVNMDHCLVLYGGNNGSSTTDVFYLNGGSIAFDNSILAHSHQYAVGLESGSWSAVNSAIYDCYTVFRHFATSMNVNCVFDDITYLSNNGGQTFKNCAITRVATALCWWTDNCSYQNCLIWNPAGFGPQSSEKVGTSGNLWGDPCFRDPEAGDFRTKRGSACIDAGLASAAPELDFYGQPRDGAPDIGLYEAVGDGVVGLCDLAPVEVSPAATSLVAGETLRVSWRTANVGATPVSGSWRDRVSLVDATGTRSVDLGTVVSSGSLAVGATNAFGGSFRVPAEAEGAWFVAVHANAERDLFEGVLGTNNVLVSASAVTVSIPAAAPSDGVSGSASADAPGFAKVAADGGALLVRVSAPAGTVVYLGADYLPSAGGYTARAVAGADGTAVLAVPAGTDAAYLVVESATGAPVDWSASFENGSLAVSRVSVPTLPYAGTATLGVTGAAFADGCTAALVRGGAVAAGAIQKTAVLSTTTLSLTLDCSKLAQGATYDLRVTAADGATATLANAVTVATVPPKAELKASLDVPATVRRGRTVTAWIDYENVGNAEMPAPVFEIVSEGQVFQVGDAVSTNSVRVMGLSSEAPVGSLRPGEPQRLGVKVTLLSQNIQWTLKSHHALQEGAKKPFRLETVYDADWVRQIAAVTDKPLYTTIAAAAGSTLADYYRNLAAYASETLDETAGTVGFGELADGFLAELYEESKGVVQGSASQGDGNRLQSTTVESAAQPRSATPRGLLGDGISADDGEWLEGTKYDNDNSNPGDVWWWRGGSPGWFRPKQDENTGRFSSSKGILLICHGHANSIHEDWIRDLAINAISSGMYDVVLASDWGAHAFSKNPDNAPVFPELTAPYIPDDAATTVARLRNLGVSGDRLTVVGHSHGSHYAGQVANRMGAKRMIGLDTSPMWTHEDARTRYPEAWNGKSASVAEFYKTSWDYSMGTDPDDRVNSTRYSNGGEIEDSVFGKPSFFVSRTGDFFKDAYKKGERKHVKYGRAKELHGFACTWASESFASMAKWDWTDAGKTWKALSGLDGDLPARGIFAGVIRGLTMECGYQARSAVAAGLKVDMADVDWRYEEYMFGKVRKPVPGATYLTEAPPRSIPSLQRKMLGISEHLVEDFLVSGAGSEEVLLTGENYDWYLTVLNLADNLSIDYNHSDFAKMDKPWDSGFARAVAVADVTDAPGEVASIIQSIQNGEKRLSKEQIDRLQDAGLRFNPVAIWDGVYSFMQPGKDDSAPISKTAPVPAAVFGNARKGEERTCLFVGAVGIYGSTLKNNGKFVPFAGELCYDNNFAAFVKVVRNENPTSEVLPGEAVGWHWSTTIYSAFAPENVRDDNTWTANADGTWTVKLTGATSYGPTNIVSGLWTGADCAVSPRAWSENPNVTVTGTLPRDETGDFVPARTYTVSLDVKDANGETASIEYSFTVHRSDDEDPGETEDSDGSREVQSSDPNEMAGPEGEGADRVLKPGDWATYTIYFENKSDAEAAAASVSVVEELSEQLDWNTFEMLEVGFGQDVDIGLAGKASGTSEASVSGTNLLVRTQVALDTETGSVSWYLRIVDPNGDEDGWPLDVYGGFLPPNDPETHCGEGHITYRAKVREDAEPGARIDASATIVFDYNDPIETDPAWWNTVATRGRAGYLDPGSSFWGVGFGTPDAPLGHGDYVAQNGLQGIETTANADGTSTHHVLGAGDPSDLQRAIDGASPGDTILVGPGCYGPVRVTRNRLSILSTDGRQRTYVNGLYAATCVDMRGTSGCRIDGFTLVQGLGPNGGGIAGGSAADCLVAGCRATGDGGGAWNAALTDCVLDANVAGGAGGGAFGGSLNRCEVRGNSAATRGGGIASASATGCLLAGNRAPYGGGAHGATLMNCTVADNVAGVSGGGTWGGTTRNSIVVSNALASGAAANWAGSSTFQHTCTTPIPKGAGNFHAAPRFVGQETGNYHLSNYSKCRDRGNRNLTRAPYDLAGLDRVMGANIDVGCYEYATQVTPLDAADYDGDGVPDIGFYNPATTTWFLRQTTDGTVRREKLGAAGITVVPRDYDGDGIRDPATYNPANGTWQILPSATGAVATRKLGWKGITLVDAADCDGDGRADPIIFNPASKTWQVLRSSDGGTTVVPNFGWAGIKPVCGDYDGDGIAELAFYSPTSGTWYVRRWDGTQRTLKLGKAGVRVSPLDADFDGALDPCHFDPATGTWTWRSLVTGEGGTAKFGDSTVSPHPFDWDGDGVPDTFGFYSPYRAGFLDLFLEADGTRRAYMTNF